MHSQDHPEKKSGQYIVQRLLSLDYDGGVSSYAGAEDRPRTLTTLPVIVW